MKDLTLVLGIVLVASVVALPPAAHGSIIQFNGLTQGNNSDLPTTSYGSNLSSDIAGATVSNGATPDIALLWGPAASQWDLHGKSNTYWDTLDSDHSTVNVVQLERYSDNTIRFTVGDDWALQLNSLDIGHASDQGESPFSWTMTIDEVGGGTVLTHITAPLDANDTEHVAFGFSGQIGVDYVLTFDPGSASNHMQRGAIDNLSFNQFQLSPVPEPATMAALALAVAGLGGYVRKRRRA